VAVSLLRNYAFSPQAFVDNVKDFLELVGWSLVTTVSGVSSDKDYVFSSEGEDPPSNDDVYIRLRGYQDHIYLYGYSFYQDATTYSGEVHDSIYSRTYAAMSDFEYWVFADKDHVKFVLGDTANSDFYHGYVGLINTYYSTAVDTLPILVFGTQGASRYWGDGLSARMMPSSGDPIPYEAWSSYSTTYSDSVRTSQCGYTPLKLYTTSGSVEEVRGEPKGVFETASSCAGAGVELMTASGVYYAFSKSAGLSKPYVYGPVGSGVACP